MSGSTAGVTELVGSVMSCRSEKLTISGAKVGGGVGITGPSGGDINEQAVVAARRKNVTSKKLRNILG